MLPRICNLAASLQPCLSQWSTRRPWQDRSPTCWIAENRCQKANLFANRKREESVTEAKASGRYRCSTCDHNFPNRSRLNKHLESKAHKEQARLAQGWEIPVPRNQRYRCLTCSHNFSSRRHLNVHLSRPNSTKIHKERVRVAQGGKSKAFSTSRHCNIERFLQKIKLKKKTTVLPYLWIRL